MNAVTIDMHRDPSIRESDDRQDTNAPDYICLRDYGGAVVRLQDYNRVVPDGAERIRSLLEQQAAHRRRSASREPWLGFSMIAGLFAGAFMMTAAALIRAC